MPVPVSVKRTSTESPSARVDTVKPGILALMKTVVTVRMADGRTRRVQLLGGNDMGDADRQHGTLTYSFDPKLVPLLRKAGISGGETVIVYENDLDTQFGGSCRGYFQLCFFGHPNPGILDGGFDRWRTEGFPTDSKPTRPIPADA